MPDEFDNQALPEDDIDVPEGDDQDVDTPEDDGDDFDFDGLTDAEIEAINAGDDTDDDTDGEQDDDQDTDSDSSDGDDQDATADTTDDDADSATDDQQRQSDNVTQQRTDIDAQFDAKLTELEELGEQLDNGDMYEGKYNAVKARIEREIKRIESREAELVTKEDAIAERETTAKEQSQNEFTTAITGFMALPENSVFVKGSPEFTALDQQLGVVAANMPEGTPFDVLLSKARNVVGAYMELPEAEKVAAKAKPKDKQQETMPSIASMPAVVPNSTDGNKFVHLDKLGGPELERALADMSDEQQNEYLNT